MKYWTRYNIQTLAEEVEYKKKIDKQRKENLKLLWLLFLSLLALSMIFYVRFILLK